MSIANGFCRRFMTTAFAVTVAMASIGCASAHPDAGTPKPEIFDQEVIKINLNYKAKKIDVDPESVKIYLQWNEDDRDDNRPSQARWVVNGLKPGHTLYIFPKKESPKVKFDYPKVYRDTPAFFIDSENNSIRSGEPFAIPGLEKGKGYTDRERGKYGRGEKPVFAKWNYDVAVVDEDGEELFRVDPVLIILGHP